jgi:putative membrane protein
MSERRLFFLLAVSSFIFWVLLAGLFLSVDYFSGNGLVWAWWPILSTGVFLLAAALIFVIIGYATGEAEWGSSAEEARQILDERYARGEISREEYLRMRDDLRAR